MLVIQQVKSVARGFRNFENYNMESILELVYKSVKSRFNELFGVGRYYLKVIGTVRKDDHRILYINPNEVVYTVSRDDPTLKGNSVWHFGSTKGGDWDLNGYPIREYGNLYRIMKQRIENKLEYEQIPEFREKLEIIENGGSWYGCKTKDEYIRHWQKMEKLYYSIMENGYKTQRELGSKNVFDEIRIQIGRKGELLFEEGFHRLVVAQMLNLEKIPVVVYRRHKAWANLRKDVKKIVLKRGFFHQAFNHQDMDILPQWYGNELKDQAFYGNERWGYVLNSLPVKQGTVLDIGAYFGYFCHRFEDLGFECYAVELDKDNFKVLKEYRDMLGKKFTVWNKNMFEIERFDYDVVLAMNVFHHTVKTRENHEKLKAFLGRLRCKAMYFEPGLSDKPNVYKSYKEEEFVDFVISNSSLKHSRLLGHTKVGRNLYLLTP